MFRVDDRRSLDDFHLLENILLISPVGFKENLSLLDLLLYFF